MCDFYLTALASSQEDCTLNVSVYMHTNHNKYIVFEKHPILYRGFITLRVDGGCFYLQQNFLLFFAFPIFYSLIHISELCLTSHHYLCIISHIYLYHLFLFLLYSVTSTLLSSCSLSFHNRNENDDIVKIEWSIRKFEFRMRNYFMK